MATTSFNGRDYTTTNPNIASYGSSPFSSSLQGMISTFKTPAAVTPTNLSTMALPQYDAMRARLNSQYAQQQSMGQDAIDRQFAAMGGGPGNGAQLKQTENLTAGIAQAKSNDLNNINAEEAASRTGLQQQDAQQNLQAQEFNTQMGLQGQQMKFGEASTIAGLNTAFAQAQQQSQNDAFNQAMAQYQAQHSGGLFGGGGFLGTGIGA